MDARVQATLLAWPVLCALAVWSAPLPLALALAATVTLAFLSAPVVSSQRFGQAARAPVELACNARDRWFVRLRDGSSEELELSALSRVFPGVLLLLFRGTRTEGGGLRRWMVLANGLGDAPGLRRLRVRVGLDLARRPRAGWFQAPGEGLARGHPASRGCSRGAVATTIRPRNNLN